VTVRACSEARELLSVDLDREALEDLGIAVDDHVAARTHLEGCAECRRFVRDAESVRTALRFEVLVATPDVSSTVIARLATDRHDALRPTEGLDAPPPVRSTRDARSSAPRGRTRRLRTLVPIAACFIVGVLLGATLVGGRAAGPPPVAAATVPERVAAAQRALESIDADVAVHEYGWQAAVPTRTFDGRLRFAAPESLALSLRDTTSYPGATWVPNDVDLVVRGDSSWSRGLRACATPVVPACGRGSAIVTSVDNREPFDAGSVAPLDLLVPVRSFARADEPAGLGTAVIAGRRADGVVTTAAQAAPLLDGFKPAGNLRTFYPTDRVELWLDREALVPLAIRVIASATDDRRVWASSHGYTELANDVVLSVQLSRVEIDGAVDPTAFSLPVPADATVDDAGFTSSIDQGRPAGRVVPSTLPVGFVPVRSGTVAPAGGPVIVVRSWASGRAWLKVRASDQWTGRRLLGDLGPVVRAITLASGTTAFTNAEGTRVAIHGDGVDVVVEGSLTRDELVAVASGLGVAGSAVPDDWAEAATATLDDAVRVLPGIVLPSGPEGFEPPALRVDGGVVTAGYAGAGGRAFVIVASSGDQLGPPLDVSAWGLDVRGSAGRYSSERGELEWVEDHVVYSVRSSSMAMGELVDIAASMGPP